ncbi:SDR family NAD(P)-dependent oxidoreductase [Curtobacterium sp. MCJR17_043]|uniref:SDR family NAD(P)-dependent oxidoreductase n=1 Tax=Curtobacterium sp. MCJR17_043 TaxID=2175660 RepID=UPI0024DF670B|nr:SDR family NAD(P)-dependent oxidoreductase [Curtobacterium sp. MCJR17_043]WIB34849.1 SDR family NAD(P)-dependent oxidoreductase [Curtobacterium sp. MCJR17_043]
MGSRFRGKVVVITGASSGIGRAAAHEFAKQGATLVLAARGEQSLEEAAAECRKLGAEAVAIPTDVADERQVNDLVGTVTSRFGRIDVFVGNAALFVYGLFEQTPTEAFKRVVDTNLHGHVHAVKALLPHWKQRGEGTYVLVGSIQSLLSAPYQSAYVTSKHAALGLMDVLADEHLGTRIRFGAVLPSTIDTPIYQNGANYTEKASHPLPPDRLRAACGEGRRRRGPAPQAQPLRRAHPGRARAGRVHRAVAVPPHHSSGRRGLRPARQAGAHRREPLRTDRCGQRDRRRLGREAASRHAAAGLARRRRCRRALPPQRLAPLTRASVGREARCQLAPGLPSVRRAHTSDP